MQKITIAFENCYGIRKLDAQFDFTIGSTYAIYAPNGAMKSSFAQTFRDFSEGKPSKDRVFPSRTTIRTIIDEAGNEVPKEEVVVIHPYDESISHSHKTSTLLVNQALRLEYERLHEEVDAVKGLFLKALKDQSGSKKDPEKELSDTFGGSIYQVLLRLRDEVMSQDEARFASVKYDIVFDEKVVSLLETKDFNLLIKDYILRYNELISGSIYFKRGVFNYYNAANVAKSLSDNGFFLASHEIILNADERVEIKSKLDLENLIVREKEKISDDSELRKKFSEVEKYLEKNAQLREFQSYISENEYILPHLSDISKLKVDVWKSYLKEKSDIYLELIESYQSAEARRKEIEAEASTQRTQWERVIDIFNDRFFVPFKLVAKNRIPVILGEEPVLSLDFVFSDGMEQSSVDKNTLMQTLSTGERRAFYILNVLFEIEIRRAQSQPTLFVIDDIADSFDYKNKYAIIQYLMDIAEVVDFRQIILTHNFDFFRTISSRFVRRSCCFMVVKNPAGIKFEQAVGVNNIFIFDWKKSYYRDDKKKLASIPFIRNIVEYTKGQSDPYFLRLTSLLHWKNDSNAITIGDLDEIFNNVFEEEGASQNPDIKVVDLVIEQASECLEAHEGLNFENKVVLSIATRLLADKYMVREISDDVFTNGITSNQTSQLLRRYKSQFQERLSSIEILERVQLMTPQNIHLNSFMYEPILDMSDEHLRKLYSDVNELLCS